MSAWIVSKAHIDVLVQALAESEIVVNVAPDKIGRTLWLECRKSVADRYPNHLRDLPGPGGLRLKDIKAYTYTRPAERYSPDVLLLQANCYEYQSCEHGDGWKTSQAREWIELLGTSLEQAGASRDSAAYRSGPWGID